MPLHPRLSLLPVCIATIGPVPALAQSMICTVEMSAGIALDRSTGKWTTSTFRPEAKYVVRRSSNPKFKYEVAQLGGRHPTAFCEREFEQGVLRCAGFGHEFYFSRGDMRFLSFYKMGYWNESAIAAAAPGRREGDDTPAVNAGPCAAL